MPPRAVYIVAKPENVQTRTRRFAGKELEQKIYDGFVYNYHPRMSASSAEWLRCATCGEQFAARSNVITHQKDCGKPKQTTGQNASREPCDPEASAQSTSAKPVMFGMQHRECPLCLRCCSQGHNCLLKAIPELGHALGLKTNVAEKPLEEWSNCSCPLRRFALTTQPRFFDGIVAEVIHSPQRRLELLMDEDVLKFIRLEDTITGGPANHSRGRSAVGVYAFARMTVGEPLDAEDVAQRMFYIGQYKTDRKGTFNLRLEGYVRQLSEPENRWSKNTGYLAKELRCAVASNQSVVMLRLTVQSCGQKRNEFSPDLLETIMMLAFRFNNLGNIKHSLPNDFLEKRPDFRPVMDYANKIAGNVMACLADRLSKPWNLTNGKADLSDVCKNRMSAVRAFHDSIETEYNVRAGPSSSSSGYRDNVNEAVRTGSYSSDNGYCDNVTDAVCAMNSQEFGDLVSMRCLRRNEDPLEALSKIQRTLAPQLTDEEDTSADQMPSTSGFHAADVHGATEPPKTNGSRHSSSFRKRSKTDANTGSGVSTEPPVDAGPKTRRLQRVPSPDAEQDPFYDINLDINNNNGEDFTL